jgi:hypothetical protein
MSHRHRHDAESRQQRQINNLERIAVMLDREVQDAVDKIHKTQSLTDSLVAADVLRDKQIADLKAQIAAIPAGTALSDEDKAALLEATNNIDAVNAKLQTAIPANTETTAGPLVVPAAEGAILVADPNAPRPDPLPGTGAPPSLPSPPPAAVVVPEPDPIPLDMNGNPPLTVPSPAFPAV